MLPGVEWVAPEKDPSVSRAAETFLQQVNHNARSPGGLELWV